VAPAVTDHGRRRGSARRDEAKAGTRRRILRAAMEIFAREGYHAARMDAIAKAAGTSKGALYFHFPGKLELFSALVDDFAATLAEEVSAAIARHASGVARVEAAVTAALTLLGRHQALARIVLIEAASLGPYTAKRQAILGRFAALVRGHLDEARAEGSIPPIDTSVAAYAWLGALTEVVMQALRGELGDLAATAPALSTLLLRSVGAVRPGAPAVT
jgi:TetR/AcrR family fatty acid metabolism transcriptional regulator